MITTTEEPDAVMALATRTARHIVAQAERFPKYVICNADESEPLIFKDRVLIDSNPHQILEGMAIAGYATGASTGAVRSLPVALRWIGAMLLISAGAALADLPVPPLTARVIAVDHFDPAEVKPVWAGVGHNSRAAE